MAAKKILIHTSVKLVTQPRDALCPLERILIHTSVKLVTASIFAKASGSNILIHTSVKLVTKVAAPFLDITLQRAHHSAGHEILFRSKRAHRNDGEPIH